MLGFSYDWERELATTGEQALLTFFDHGFHFFERLSTRVSSAAYNRADWLYCYTQKYHRKYHHVPLHVVVNPVVVFRGSSSVPVGRLCGVIS